MWRVSSLLIGQIELMDSRIEKDVYGSQCSLVRENQWIPDVIRIENDMVPHGSVGKRRLVDPSTPSLKFYYFQIYGEGRLVCASLFPLAKY
jgi:hypothetical protein